MNATFAQILNEMDEHVERKITEPMEIITELERMNPSTKLPLNACDGRSGEN